MDLLVAVGRIDGRRTKAGEKNSRDGKGNYRKRPVCPRLSRLPQTPVICVQLGRIRKAWRISTQNSEACRWPQTHSGICRPISAYANNDWPAEKEPRLVQRR